MIRIHVTYVIQDDPTALERARGALREFVDAIRVEENDTRLYEAFREQSGRRFFHLMEFKDESAESRHREAPHTKRFVEKLYPLCEEEPVFTKIDLVASSER